MSAATAPRPIPTDGPTRWRLAGAITVSLLLHALLLSLQFGLPGIGLPALELPWRERRAQAIDLNVVLAPLPAAGQAAEPPPAPVAPAESAVPNGLRLVPMPAPPAPKARTKRATEKPAVAARRPRARVKRDTPVIALNVPRDNSFNMPAPALDDIPPVPEPEAEVPAAPLALPEPARIPQDDPVPQEREQAALKLAEEEKALRAREAEERAAQQLAEAARTQEEEAARQRAMALEAQRIEEAKRREAAERLALEQEERQKAEEANRAAALALQQQREDALRREREEATRRAMALEEKQRAEALRLQAEQMQSEAMELQARKQAEAEAAAEAARQQAAARERAQQARQAEELAARKKAEAEAANAGAAKREREPELLLGDSPAPNARIDALPRGLAGGGLAGRALEQARRGDSPRNDPPAARQSDSAMDAPRRRSILGGKDVDVGVMMYVESWRLKIERNGSIMYPRAAVEKANGDPVVSVAIRSDGSVEEVVIHRSSGRPELDEAVQRIVRVNARYSVFPPELARRFDVIEIRRVWNFEDKLRILEEVR